MNIGNNIDSNEVADADVEYLESEIRFAILHLKTA